MASILKKLWLPKQSAEILLMLLLTDVFFIVLHIAAKFADFFEIPTILRTYPAFYLNADLSLAESFQYVKEYWIILLFISMIFKQKQSSYAGWLILFIYLLFDDMFSIHEGLGTIALEKIDVAPFDALYAGFRYQDFAELAVSIFFGLVCLLLVAVAYRMSDGKIRSAFTYLLGYLLLIVFFGVGVDFANRIFAESANKFAYEISRLIEDGGEMVSMSLMCWYVITLKEPIPHF
ncbi:MAG: hypothetical protein L0287_36185 [Anaerolineae bacterium]|nr:hypothetical protein [Anaerolineae bacterium]